MCGGDILKLKAFKKSRTHARSLLFLFSPFVTAFSGQNYFASHSRDHDYIPTVADSLLPHFIFWTV